VAAGILPAESAAHHDSHSAGQRCPPLRVARPQSRSPPCPPPAPDQPTSSGAGPGPAPEEV